VEPKLFPHIAGQVKIARPDRIANGEDGEKLVDPAAMGIGVSSKGGSGSPYARPHNAVGPGVGGDAPSERTLGKPKDAKTGRWCARTRSYV